LQRRRFIVIPSISGGTAMPHGPRRFAKNSENTRHFRLIARSQKDPEGDNEEASGLVLEPFVPPCLRGKVDEDEMLTIPESLQHLGEVFGTGEVFDPELRGGRDEVSSDEDGEVEDDVTELDGDCYFPKDGYNYNQHLKTLGKNKKRGGVGGVVMDAAPSKDDPVKILHETDPDRTMVVEELQAPVDNEEDEVMQALLDCDNPGYEDMDDDFFDELGPGGVKEPELMLWGPAALDDNALPDMALFKEMHAQRLAAMGREGRDEEDDGKYDDEGQREPGEAVCEARFDQVLEDEYAEEEDGALDDDEIEGTMTLEDVEAMLDEYLEDREVDKKQLESINEPIAGKYDNVPRTIDETKALIERYHLDDFCNEDQADTVCSDGDTEEESSKNWDCETVLSTLSNLSNRPGKIEKLKKLIKKSAELPAIVEGGDAAEEESSDEDGVDLPDVVTDRPKNESPEDKKLRKAGVKEMRRICRKMKKESKDMYKAEAAKLDKMRQGTGDVRRKLRVMQL